MIESTNIKIYKNEDPEKLPPFKITENSRLILKIIESNLTELVSLADLRPTDEEFYRKFLIILDLYDSFQHEVINASGVNTVCGAGCSHCCCHWVEDVNSFEGVIISRYLAEHHPDLVDPVIESFREDAEVLDSLRTLVEEKMLEYGSDTDESPDPYDILLSCFYQMERPCALLDDNGFCIIYPVRPFTCRDFLNLRDPDACLPDRINEEEEATLIMNLSDEISNQIEILHRRFDRGDNDMSLRTLLVSYLESGMGGC